MKRLKSDCRGNEWEEDDGAPEPVHGQKWPPLPSEVWSQLGPVPVKLEVHPEMEEGDLGYCCPKTRAIYVRPGMDPAAAWGTLWHEVAHLALFDAGALWMSERDKEHVCDAIGTYLAGAMRGGYLASLD